MVLPYEGVGVGNRVQYAKPQVILAGNVHPAEVHAWVRWTQGLASVAIYVGALLAFRRWRAEPAVWPLTASIVTFSLVNALYYRVLRYRMVIEPCLLLMAGLGWASVWEHGPWQRRMRVR